MIKNVFIGIIMIKLLANKNTLFGLSFAILIGGAEVSYSAEVDIFTNATHQYSSYAEFANSVCLPCHYRNISNGTDLQERFPNATEAEIKSILLPILKDGNMPPNDVYRKILYGKFLQIK